MANVDDLREEEVGFRVFERLVPWTEARKKLNRNGFFLLGLGAVLIGVGVGVAGAGGVAGIGAVIMLVVAPLSFLEAVRTRRDPQRVEVDEEGITVYYPEETKEYRWADLSHAAILREFGHTYGVWLYDAAGRRCEKLAGSFENVRAMSRLIQRQVAESRTGVRERVRLQRHWGVAAIALSVGLIMAPGSAVFAWAAIQEVRDAWRMEAESKLGEAVVRERYREQGDNAYWIAYTMVGVGAATGREAVQREFWDHVTEGSTVAVRYVPGDPSLVELRSGSASRRYSLLGSAAFVTFWALGFGFGFFMLAGAICHVARLSLEPSVRWYRYRVVREAVY